MIVNLNYIPGYIDEKGKQHVIRSLVRCDGCGKERIVTKYNLVYRKKEGDFCKKCGLKPQNDKRNALAKITYNDKGEVILKECPECHKEKLPKEFYRTERTNKLYARCIECTRRISSNRETSDLEHKERMKQYRNKWKQNNPDKDKEAKQKYSKSEHGKGKAKERSQRKENKILQGLRSRIRHAIRSNNAKKCAKSKELLGCEVDFFCEYLENLFEDGMSWDNYGPACGQEKFWEMDHIVPCRFYNLILPAEQRKCFYYKNCRPRWSEDNRAKSDILPDGRRARDVRPNIIDNTQLPLLTL